MSKVEIGLATSNKESKEIYNSFKTRIGKDKPKSSSGKLFIHFKDGESLEVDATFISVSVTKDFY